MRAFITARHTLTASAALALLAGCSGGSSQMSPVALGQISGVGSQSAQAVSGSKLLGQPATRSFFNPSATGKPLIFAADDSHSVVDIFLQAKGNAQVGQIVGDIYGPVGLATDAAGNVYVVNQYSGLISIFAPPYTKPPKLTLDDGASSTPADVAVSARGLVAVANFNSTVSFFRANSTKPCVTVGDPKFGAILHDAFDDGGDLYIDGSVGAGVFTVGKIRGGCNATKIEKLSTGNVIGLAGGIKVDKCDRIAIGDYRGDVIYTYNRPTNGSLGNPVTTTPLMSGPYAFAFAASGQRLYVANGRTIEEYAYPAGGAVIASISISSSSHGVAVTPPLIP